MDGIADKAALRKCTSESHLPVFQQEWWRSVVARTPGYRVNTVVREKRVLGTLPYLLKPRLGIRVGVLPWTNLTGPLISDVRLSEGDRIRVVEELVKGIPPHISMRYRFDSDDPNASLYVSIFEKAHFALEIERNFREPPDASDVFKRVVRRHKNPINQAMKHFDIVDVGPEFFTQFYASNLESRGRALRADISIATDLLSEGLRRGQTRIRAARSKIVNADGEYVYHAAVATAEDRTRVFLGWMLELSSPAARMSVTQLVPGCYPLPLSRRSGVCEKPRSCFRCQWRAHPRPHGKLRRNHRGDKAGRPIRHGASEYYQQCICSRQAPISRCIFADVGPVGGVGRNSDYGSPLTFR